MPLTPKQEHFAQLLASGLSQAEAYRQSYNVRPGTPWSTYHDDASELARHPLVSPRVKQLKDAIASQITARQAWNLDRIIREAEKNLEIAREHKQLGSANGALEIIGRATGLLTEKPREQVPQITRVVVVLDRGIASEAGGGRFTEASYEVLPPVQPAGEGASLAAAQDSQE